MNWSSLAATGVTAACDSIVWAHMPAVKTDGYQVQSTSLGKNLAQRRTTKDIAHSASVPFGAACTFPRSSINWL